MKKFALLVSLSLVVIAFYKSGILPATPVGDLLFVSACVPVVAMVAMLGGGFTSTLVDRLRARR